MMDREVNIQTDLHRQSVRQSQTEKITDVQTGREREGEADRERENNQVVSFKNHMKRESGID